jgi:two-component system, NtrC family, nitrogen regulation response regulator NtrX
VTKILLVEDDVHTRRVVKAVLESEGFEVAEAEDGLSGVAAVESFNPACILTDNMMPRLDGLGMLAELKKRGSTTPAIMVSAAHELPPSEELRALGVVETVSKPFAFDHLVQVVRRIAGG